jgi:hypothetical protein
MLIVEQIKRETVNGFQVGIIHGEFGDQKNGSARCNVVAYKRSTRDDMAMGG